MVMPGGSSGCGRPVPALSRVQQLPYFKKTTTVLTHRFFPRWKQGGFCKINASLCGPLRLGNARVRSWRKKARSVVLVFMRFRRDTRLECVSVFPRLPFFIVADADRAPLRLLSPCSPAASNFHKLLFYIYARGTNAIDEITCLDRQRENPWRVAPLALPVLGLSVGAVFYPWVPRRFRNTERLLCTRV